MRILNRMSLILPAGGRALATAGTVVLGLVILLPVALLIAAAYYVAALAQAAWSLLRFATGQKSAPPVEPLQGPHLWTEREQPGAAVRKRGEAS